MVSNNLQTIMREKYLKKKAVSFEGLVLVINLENLNIYMYLVIYVQYLN